MSIDWDALIEETDDSPRGILAGLLGCVEEIKSLAVVWEDNNGYTTTWNACESRAQVIGLVAYAHFRLMREIEVTAGD